MESVFSGSIPLFLGYTDFCHKYNKIIHKWKYNIEYFMVRYNKYYYNYIRKEKFK